MFAVEKYLQLLSTTPGLNRDYLYSHVIQYLQQSTPDDLQTMFIDITLFLRPLSPPPAILQNRFSFLVNKFLATSLAETPPHKKYVDHLNDRFMNPSIPHQSLSVPLLQSVVPSVYINRFQFHHRFVHIRFSASAINNYKLVFIANISIFLGIS